MFEISFWLWIAIQSERALTVGEGVATVEVVSATLVMWTVEISDDTSKIRSLTCSDLMHASWVSNSCSSAASLMESAASMIAK